MSRPGSLRLGLILLILITGTFLRFRHITQKGIFFHDEGYFLLVAKTYYYLPSFVKDVAMRRWTGERIDLKTLLDKYYYWGFFAGSYTTRPGLGTEAGKKPTLAAGFAGKPGFLSLVILSMFAVGPSADYASFLVSAVLGAATIFIVFLIGRDLGGWRMGLLCAALLAVSPAHVLYSREGLTPATSGFFLALYLVFYLRGNLALSGLTLGYALSTHESIILLIPIALVVEAYRGGLRRASALFLWITVPVIAWEVLISAQKIVLGRLGVYHRSFFQELLFHGKAGIGADWDPLFYGDVLVSLEGIIPFLLFIAGVGVAFLRMPILLPFVLIPLGVWSVFPGKHARLIAPYIPWMAIVSASLLDGALSAMSKKNTWALSLMISAVILLSLPQSMKMVSLSSGYPEAARYIRSMGKNVRVANIGQEPIWRFYLDRRVLSTDNPTEIEREADVYAVEGGRASHKTMEYLSHKTYKEFENNFRRFYPLYLEDGGRAHAKDILKSDPDADKLKIYTIKSLSPVGF